MELTYVAAGTPAAPPALPELALAGKMQPVSSKVKTNPLQVASFCLRLFG